MMGVEYDLFWTLNPKSLEPFIEAFSIQREYDDLVSWREGMYIRLAVASILDSKSEYPKEPFGMDNEPETAEDRETQIRNRFLEQMVVINSRFKEDVRN